MEGPGGAQRTVPPLFGGKMLRDMVPPAPPHHPLTPDGCTYEAREARQAPLSHRILSSWPLSSGLIQWRRHECCKARFSPPGVLDQSCPPSRPEVSFSNFPCNSVPITKFTCGSRPACSVVAVVLNKIKVSGRRARGGKSTLSAETLVSI